MTPSRMEDIRRVASEWEFDKRIPAYRAAALLRELLGRIDALERGIGQRRLLEGLPLPPAITARLAYLEEWQVWARDINSWACSSCQPHVGAMVCYGTSKWLCGDCAAWLADHPMPEEPA